MRFIILVKATSDSEAGVMPSEELFTAMAAYHEDLAKAGVLLDGNGLHPSARGWRITWSGGTQTITDGPFTETKELVAGYTVIQARSPEEALEWARRMPMPHEEGRQIELRQLFELEEFGQSEAVERFRDMGISTPK